MVVSCRQGKVVAAVAVSGRGVACRKQAGVTTAPGEVSQQQQLLLRDSTAQCCSYTANAALQFAPLGFSLLWLSLGTNSCYAVHSEESAAPLAACGYGSPTLPAQKHCITCGASRTHVLAFLQAFPR